MEPTAGHKNGSVTIKARIDAQASVVRLRRMSAIGRTFQALEPRLEPMFHTDSYGYRPGRSAIDAVRQARQRCWRYDWVLDLDVKAYFDSIDWELMLRADLSF